MSRQNGQRSRISTDRSDALGIVDRIRSLCDTVERAYETGHEYAFGKPDYGTDEQDHKPKTGPKDWTGDIVVDQRRARGILRKSAGRIVAWEQSGLRVLEALSDMVEKPEDWEPLESSQSFGPINQDTTTQVWKEGDAQRNKRRIQAELQRIELRKSKLQSQLREIVRSA